MKHISSLVATLCSVIILASCSSIQAPPDIPPAYTGEYPEITEGAYATYETTRVFNAPLEPLRLFIEDGNKIVAAMEETDNIKKPVVVVVLSGDWPEEGAVRRLEFSDGHYTLERVIESNFPTLFRYQVWDFTTAAGNNLDYAIGQQAWQQIDSNQSKLTWTYSLRPNASFKRFFVQRFVDNDMQPLMDNALDKVQAQANDAFSEEQ